MIQIENLERYLERGTMFGFQTIPHNALYIGWISLSKRKVSNRFFEIFDTENGAEKYEDQLYIKEKYKEQFFIKEKPYMIRVVELKKELIDSDRYPLNEDYNVNECHYFHSLVEVSSYLENNWNLFLNDIKWYTEIVHD